MHGRKKVEQPKSERQIWELKTKTENLKKVLAAVSKLRSEYLATKSYSVQNSLLKLSEKLIKINPDYYSLWNYRKEALVEVFGANDLQQTEKSIENELKLSEIGIKSNPKSYGAWYHRKWVLEKANAEENYKNKIFSTEIKLCEKLLLLDNRNFHCWGYKDWVENKLETSLEGKLQFTTLKIEENFSNYSAFHYRSKILPTMIANKTENEKLSQLNKELNMIHQAIYTEPDDQSVWWYYFFVIHFSNEAIQNQSTFMILIQNEIKCVEELLDEDNCKWGMKTFHHLLGFLAKNGSDNSSEYKEKRKKILQTLLEIDPMHQGYYSSLVE